MIASDTLRFSGAQRENYCKWSRDFQRETEELDLSDIQQLDFLKVKTSGAARAAIQPIVGLETEVATSQILSHAWSFLKKRFDSPQKPSEELFKNLTRGPPITTGNVDALGNFASSCEAALALEQANPTLFATLTDRCNQISITNRLEGELSFEWHKHKCLNFPGATVVPFSVFSEWIGKQATWRITQHLEQSG